MDILANEISVLIQNFSVIFVLKTESPLHVFWSSSVAIAKIAIHISCKTFIHHTVI